MSEEPAPSWGLPALPESPAWEALALVKRQHRERSRAWSELLEAKERALSEARDRLARAEALAADLRARLRREEEEGLARGLEAESRLAAFLEERRLEREKEARERKALQDLLESARACLSAQSSGDSQETLALQARSRDLEERLAAEAAALLRAREETEALREKSARQREALAKAKTALEKVLAELMAERAELARSEKERDEALAGLAEARKRYAGLSGLWEEERTQWERLSGVPARGTPAEASPEPPRPPPAPEPPRPPPAPEAEAAPETPPEGPAPLTAAALEPEAPREALPEVREAAEPRAEPEPEPSGAGREESLLSRLGAWLSGLAGFRAAGPGLPRLGALSVHPVALDRPTGLAFDGRLLWACEEGGRLVAFETQYFEAVRAVAVASAPFRPAGLCWAEGSLWSADEAGGRLVRHDGQDPERLLAQRPCPAARPHGLAWDGTALWLWDAGTKAFMRLPPGEGEEERLSLEGDVLIQSLAWADGRLWAFDALSSRLLVLERRGAGLGLLASLDLGGAALGLAPDGSLLWGLMRTQDGSFAIARFRR